MKKGAKLQRLNWAEVTSKFALALMAALVVLGLSLQALVIPAISNTLSATYVEYSDASLFIQLILNALVLIGEVILALIALLLWRIQRKSLLQASSTKLALSLSWSFLALFAGICTLGVWLISRNTFPPFLSISFTIGAMLSCIAALVTASLTRVLNEATVARYELERVI